ncbi:MAG: phosphomannose isomerase type II C-terminal cupin domain [Acidobacteria bacterium]|nr:phosphomannose isomerase type II C-terminal cupin domain [Acidobacteriota bacterium]MDW7983547.1 phosphomannose isomerase type II C-terminal cupin domain [Acidobacteriota bacterium]
MDSLAGREIPTHEPTYDERPWGTWELLGMGPDYKVKRLVVRPGHRLSLQYHHYRSEHWVVVQGEALVQRDGETLYLKPDEGCYIPARVAHRVTNPGAEPLVIVEVQFGHCREDDIVRIEDDYGRATPAR